MAHLSPGQRVRTQPVYPAPWGGMDGTVLWATAENVRVQLDCGEAVTCAPREVVLLDQPALDAQDLEELLRTTTWSTAGAPDLDLDQLRAAAAAVTRASVGS